MTVWPVAVRWGRDQWPQFPPPDPHLLPSPPVRPAPGRRGDAFRLQALTRPEWGESPVLSPTAARLCSLREATLGQPRRLSFALLPLHSRSSRLTVSVHSVPAGRPVAQFSSSSRGDSKGRQERANDLRCPLRREAMFGAGVQHEGASSGGQELA